MGTRFAVIGLALLACGCGGNPPPAMPAPPVFDRVTVPQSVPGWFLFCVEEPGLNSTDVGKTPLFSLGTVCPWTVDDLRSMIAKLRKADD